jgi:hypothetical protein
LAEGVIVLDLLRGLLISLVNPVFDRTHGFPLMLPILIELMNKGS